MNHLVIVIASTLLASSCLAFVSPMSRVLTATAKHALSEDVISQLDDMSGKYLRLLNLDSEDSKAEQAGMHEIVEKYNTYKEIDGMMRKLRLMWRAEASENRKSRQLKSFIELYNGKLELEEVLKEKLGLPFTKDIETPKELADILRLETKISDLETKLTDVELKIAPGMSTREERFSF
jgi:hypothetical protein